MAGKPWQRGPCPRGRWGWGVWPPQACAPFALRPCEVLSSSWQGAGGLCDALHAGPSHAGRVRPPEPRSAGLVCRGDAAVPGDAAFMSPFVTKMKILVSPSARRSFVTTGAARICSPDAPVEGPRVWGLDQELADARGLGAPPLGLRVAYTVPT